jgi:diacylglycerol kinase family enzyme
VKSQRLLIVNPRSGDDSPSAGELAAEAARLGVEAHVLAKDESPVEVAESSGAEILGMAGGDGSLGAVAGVALETGAAFVCVPFGTRNHFARDLGLDRDDPIASLAAFGNGAERQIDVGRVADRVFLNNVSLGVYAGLVHRRERHRRRGEVLARARGLLHAPVNGEPLAARVIFVGNNRYELSLFTVGERERLDEGCLHLWGAEGLLPTAWEERSAGAFTIDLESSSVRAAIDGEPVMLETPIDVRSEARALRVLLPHPL